jgi:prevent-host-death family protein
MSHSWQLQDAKNKLSEVIARAEKGEAQVVTKHGVATAVVISYAEYQRLTAPARRLSEFMQTFPHDGEELMLDRNDSALRDDLQW